MNLNRRAQILKRVRDRVLKSHVNFAGIDYEVWARHLNERTPQLTTASTEDFESGVRGLLAELGTSHTVFYHESASGNRVLPQHSINATLSRFKQDGEDRWFFLDIFEDGPAHRAGIKRGDLLLAVDGAPISPPEMPVFGVGRTFVLTVGNPNGGSCRDIPVVVPAVNATRQRLPIVEPKPLTYRMIAPGVGLLRIVYFPGTTGMRFAKALDAAVRDLVDQGCGRLIVDLRGNIGGSLGFARLASYLCPGKLPIGHSVTPQLLRSPRDLGALPRVPMPRSTPEFMFTLARFAFRDKSVALLTQGLGPQPFHGRIVLLVNEWTNSAAEMVASFASEDRLAKLVGAKTAGNVLGAANFRVGGGYWLRLPIFGWRTSNGKTIEGKGVEPDLALTADPCTWTHCDRQLESAIEIVKGGGPAVGSIC